LLHLKPPFLLPKSLFQRRGRLNIKIKENAEKIFSFFLNQMIMPIILNDFEALVREIYVRSLTVAFAKCHFEVSEFKIFFCIKWIPGLVY
jgi:hypothetical protein